MLNIEILSISNVHEIAAMAFKLWPESSFEEELNYFQGIIGDEDKEVFLIRDSSTPAGFVHATLRVDYVEGTNTSPVCYVEGIYVEPDYRRSGIAKKLINEAERWGKRHSCSEIASDAEIMNETSIDFHKKVGFAEINRLVCFAKKIEP